MTDPTELTELLENLEELPVTVASSGHGWDSEHVVRAIRQLQEDNAQLQSEKDSLTAALARATEPGEYEGLLERLDRAPVEVGGKRTSHADAAAAIRGLQAQVAELQEEANQLNMALVSAKSLAGIRPSDPLPDNAARREAWGGPTMEELKEAVVGWIRNGGMVCTGKQLIDGLMHTPAELFNKHFSPLASDSPGQRHCMVCHGRWCDPDGKRGECPWCASAGKVIANHRCNACGHVWLDTTADASEPCPWCECRSLYDEVQEWRDKALAPPAAETPRWPVGSTWEVVTGQQRPGDRVLCDYDQMSVYIRRAAVRKAVAKGGGE